MQGILPRHLAQQLIFKPFDDYGSNQNLGLGAKAASQQVLPVLAGPPQHADRASAFEKGKAKKRRDSSYKGQRNVLYTETGNWQDRDGVYQSVHAEGGTKVSGKLVNVRGSVGKVPDKLEQAISRLDGVQRLQRQRLLDAQKHSRRNIRAPGSAGVPAQQEAPQA